MEINKEIIKKVKEKFGLNVYETKVWLALIMKSVASSGEISALSGVPRSRTYDVLSSLEKKGFAIEKVGKPTKYIAVEPVVVLDKLKNNIYKEAEEKIDILENLKGSKEYTELTSLHNSSIETIRKDDLSSVLNGRTNVYVHFKNILDKTKKNVMIYLPASELNEKARIFKEIFSKIKNKKLRAKIILHGKDTDVKQAAKKFNINPEITNIKAAFLVADDKVLFLLSDKIDEESKGIWINSDFFANSINRFIEKAVR